MGLDNGVVVKHIKREDLPIIIRSGVTEYGDEVEVCYWRKCWGLRNAFIHTLFLASDPDEWEFKLSINDVDFLRDLIKGYILNPDSWNDSIWEFSEVKHSLKRQWWRLTVLRYWMKFHPDKEVYFYDSY